MDMVASAMDLGFCCSRQMALLAADDSNRFRSPSAEPTAASIADASALLTQWKLLPGVLTQKQLAASIVDPGKSYCHAR